MKKILFSALAIIGCACYSLGQSVPSYVPTSGLLGWWPFTGNALDSSGNGNNGTVIGATLSQDRFNIINNAYNTSTGYIKCINNSIPSNTAFTISLWFKCYSDFGIGEAVCLGSSSNTTWGVTVGNKYFTMNYGRGCGSTFSTPALITLSDTNWHQIVYVSGGLNSTTNIYYDGTFYGNTKNANSSGLCNNSNLYFGTDIFSGIELYNGKLDDIGIWNRALSACEISKLYLASNTFFTSKPANQAVKIGASASFTIKDTLGTSATYQWQENAGTGFVNLSNTSPYSGVNTKTLDINPVAAGMHNNQYRCIRNGGTSCLDTSAAAILTLSNLSIKANQVEGLSIRPNPVHNSLNIHAPATINKLVLCNTLGQLIFESKPGTKTASIDMSVYPAGMYILKLNDEWVEKIIKE